MHTARSSNHGGGWAVPPQLPPWVWAWTRSPSTSPLVVGLETPLPGTRHPPRTRHPPGPGIPPREQNSWHTLLKIFNFNFIWTSFELFARSFDPTSHLVKLSLPNTYYMFNIEQVRDEYRTDYDSGRGGYGKIVAGKITTKQGTGSWRRFIQTLANRTDVWILNSSNRVSCYRSKTKLRKGNVFISVCQGLCP